MSWSIKTKLKNAYKPLAQEQGITLVIFAATLFALLAMLALAVDSGKLFKSRLIIQTSVDAATLAGARVLAAEGLSEEAQALAEETAEGILKENLIKNGFYPEHVETAMANAEYELHIDQLNPMEPQYRVSLSNLEADTYLFRLVPGMQTSYAVASDSQVTLRPVNVYMLIDTSNSMICPTNPGELYNCGCGMEVPGDPPCVYAHSKMALLKNAVDKFIDEFDPTRDRLGLILFNTAGWIKYPITANYGFNEAGLKAAVRSVNNPAGQTNPCDALFKAYRDMKDKDLHEKAVYVLVTDGAPTSGRFRFAQPKFSEFTSADYYFWDFFEKCTLANGNVKKNWFPSRMYRSEPNPLAKSRYYQDRPFDEDTMADWVTERVAHAANCSDLQCHALLPPGNEVDRMTHCLGDASFTTDGFDTPWDNDVNKYQGDPAYFDWNTNMREGYRFRELFYDCAIAWSDTIRQDGGILYALGIGREAVSGEEEEGVRGAYQDITDRYRIKTHFLNRITFDACGDETAENQFLGFDFYEELAEQGFRNGAMMVAEPNDPDILAEEIGEFFETIATKVKWQLTQ